MALNKSNTSIWVKILIIILIVAFVSLFMYTGIAGIFDLFKQGPTTAQSTSVDNVTSLERQFAPTVDAFKKAAASNPTSYTAQVNLANAYFDWAAKLSAPVPGKSELTTAAMTAAYAEWTQAKAAYDVATPLSKTFDASAQTDRSYAAFYSNDASGAIAIAKTVTVKAPTFSQAWAHLGIYYETTGQSALAIPAYQRYLAIDPKGTNASYVQSRLKALGTSSATSVPTTKTP